MTTHTYPEVKRVGDTGQVSVGKALAGKLVRVEPQADGVMLRFVVDVAEKDTWWLHEPYKSKLQAALSWAKANPPGASDLDALFDRVRTPATKKKRAAPKAKSRAAPKAKSRTRTKKK
jgi:hypothetical protein